MWQYLFPSLIKHKQKKRPALVLSSIEHQQQTQHITLLMITSAKNSSWPNNYLITSLEGTGLSAPPIIRQKIFTIDSRLIIKSVSKLAAADKSKVAVLLKQHLSF